MSSSEGATYGVRVAVMTIMMASAVPFVPVAPADAAGPWKAQVDYRDSQEVLTGEDGRFLIAPRWFFSLNPLVFFDGPFFAFFRAGYGRPRWPGYQEADTWPKDKREALEQYANLLKLDGIVLEMPRLQDMDQRREHVKRVGIERLTVPIEKMPLLQRAIEQERNALGPRSLIHPSWGAP